MRFSKSILNVPFLNKIGPRWTRTTDPRLIKAML